MMEKTSEQQAISVLSTKKLNKPQKELLLNSGIGLVEQQFIAVVPISFSVAQLPENILFTSQNTVAIVFSQLSAADFKGKNIFCVGEKTAVMLQEKGLKIAEVTHYGSQLARKITENYQNEEFLFFCGKKRRPELPEYLKKNKVSFSEVPVYDTRPLPKEVKRKYDGILFFSPSAIKSFCETNSLTGKKVFCIGKTTATEAEKHTTQVEIASKPTVESVLVKVIKTLKPPKGSI